MHATGTPILAAILAAAAASAVRAQQPPRAPVQVRRPTAPAVIRQAPTPPPAAPTIVHVKPIGVRAAGGTTVTIDGTGFVAGTTVTVGGAAVQGLSIISPTQVRITTAPGTAGTKDLVVTTSGGSATCAACLVFDPDLGTGEWIDTMMERGGEGPLGVWREERLQQGTATTVLMEAHCPAGWLPIGAGIENSAMTPFYIATSYPVDDKWRILMERRMVPPVGGQLLFPPAPYTFWMTLTCLNRDAFNRVMRPPS